MKLEDVKLTNKQKKHLLFVVESEKSLKDCAKDLGIHPVSLSKLLKRIDLRYPGFMARLKDMRRITIKETGRCPEEIPCGTLRHVPAASNMSELHSRMHKLSDINKPDECDSYD